MNKRELIEALAEYSDDYQIIIQKDGEGNCYSPLYNLYLGLYKPDNRYFGEMWTKDSLDELQVEDEMSEEAMVSFKKDMIDVIVLAPIN